MYNLNYKQYTDLTLGKGSCRVYLLYVHTSVLVLNLGFYYI